MAAEDGHEHSLLCSILTRSRKPIRATSLISILGFALAAACGTADDESTAEDDASLRTCTDDGNPCTRDVRVRRRCTHPALDDGTSCPNGTCQAGTCVPNSGTDDAGTGDGDAGSGSDSGTDTTDSGAPLPCDQTLSPGTNLASAIANATSGSTLCLNSGDYGTVDLYDIRKSGYVTVQSASGHGATLSPRINASSFLTEVRSVSKGDAGAQCHLRLMSAVVTCGRLPVISSETAWRLDRNLRKSALRPPSVGPAVLVEGDSR